MNQFKNAALNNPVAFGVFLGLFIAAIALMIHWGV